MTQINKYKYKYELQVSHTHTRYSWMINIRVFMFKRPTLSERYVYMFDQMSKHILFCFYHIPRRHPFHHVPERHSESALPKYNQRHERFANEIVWRSDLKLKSAPQRLGTRARTISIIYLRNIHVQSISKHELVAYVYPRSALWRSSGNFMFGCEWHGEYWKDAMTYFSIYYLCPHVC